MNPLFARIFRALGLSGLAVLLSINIPFLSPLPLMLIRRSGGFLEASLATLGGLALCYFFTPTAVGVVFLSAGLLAFILAECENQNMDLKHAGLVSFLFLLGFWIVLLGFTIKTVGFDPVSYLKAHITIGMERLQITSDQVDQGLILRQTPSAIVLVLVFAIWVNLLLVKRFESLLGMKPTALAHQFEDKEFLQWKLPDQFVWFTFLCVAGTYLDSTPDLWRWAAMNGLNVAVGVYVFQGFAVVASYFEVKKISAGWKMVMYTLLVTQLFLLLSVIGFLDLWIEFRTRINSKKSAVV